MRQNRQMPLERMTDRAILLIVARRLATLERLMLLSLQGEEQIIMDQATEVALIESAANLLRTLEAEAAAGNEQSPELQSALADLQAAVDAGSAQTPEANGAGTAVTAPDGSDTTAVDSSQQTVDATSDGSTTPA